MTPASGTFRASANSARARPAAGRSAERSGLERPRRREALDALRKWRFEPEMIAGRHIATRVRQDYVMRLEEKDAPLGKPCPDDTSGRVLAAGQKSCLAARETVLRNIRTETTVHNLP
mgnify:CR=1 FL=1